MRSFLSTTALAPTALALCMCHSANAQDMGDWLVGLGAAAVSPNSNPTHTDAGPIGANPNVRPTLTVEYFMLNNIGVELLAAWPFKHSLELDGVGKIGTTKQLPPTLTFHYYFNNPSRLTPFVGAGVNYTFFFHERARGALKGNKLKLKNSFGYSLQWGLSYELDRFSQLRADIRYIDIHTKVKLNGKRIGKVRVDPFVFGASYLVRF